MEERDRPDKKEEEIEVTSEMIQAGLEECPWYDGVNDAALGRMLTNIFRAMYRVSQVQK